MPLEVRQIGIRMEVAGGEEDCCEEGEGKKKSPALALLDGHDGDDENDRLLLIEQCVNAVLAELERRAER